MPAPAAPPGLGQLEGANVDSGRKRQFSVSGPQASGSGPIEAGMPVIPPNTDPTLNDWLNDTDLDAPEAWSTGKVSLSESLEPVTSDTQFIIFEDLKFMFFSSISYLSHSLL